jgi:hypothetical protein
MNDAVLKGKLDRVVFEIDALTGLIFDELQVRKVRAAVLVELYPNFRAVDLVVLN